MAQHAGLTEERWADFSFPQQILMIANEMQRAGKLTSVADAARRANAYERGLHLTDLTIRTCARPGARRELLRWRDLLAQLFVAGLPRPEDHASAWRSLLLLTPESARQLRG